MSGYGRTRNVQQVTIANGATTSGEAPVGAQRIVGIIMPAGWTAANISFEALVDEPVALPKVPVFGAVVDAAGSPIVVTAPAAGEYVGLPDTLGLIALGRVRVVSSAAQGAERLVGLVCTD